MRIACAQFSPQVGDIDNNLTRADAVLHKARPEQWEDLDLLVLPELAFSGFKFRSLQQIHPFLEPSGSGISSLWARTTALKYNTNVLVGYPEKVDVRDKWPTSPEYYNSAIIVNDEGETIFNYRKYFLDKADQHWALESNEGFLDYDMPGLGKVCVALGVDLNSDAPWHAFEFAFHALEVEADVVVVCLAWPTHKEARDFSQALGDPDMETLTYWVQRLEPLVRAELSRETIVVFCSRSGNEDDTLYAGTSAVVGIKEGEVSVYGLAGRGTKEFLFVDTSTQPFAKLVQNDERDRRTDKMRDIGEAPGMLARRDSVNSSKWTIGSWPGPPSTTAGSSRTTFSSTAAAPSTATWNNRSQPGVTGAPQKKTRPSPKLQIPQHASINNPVLVHPPLAEGESPTIPTPTGPSPTPLVVRPKVIVPGQDVVSAGFNRKPSPFPHDKHFQEQHRYFGNRTQRQNLVPSTPMEEAPQESTQASFYWKPSDTLLQTPEGMKFMFADPPAPDTPLNSRGMALEALTPFPGEDIPNSFSPVTARPVPSGRHVSGGSIHARKPNSSLRQSEALSPYEAALSPRRETPKSAAPSPRLSEAALRNHDMEQKHGGRRKDTPRPGYENHTRQTERVSSPRRNEKAVDPFRSVRTESPKGRQTSRVQGLRSGTINEQRADSQPRSSQPKSVSAASSDYRANGVRPPSRSGHGEDNDSQSSSTSQRRAIHGTNTPIPDQRGLRIDQSGLERDVSRGRQRMLNGQSPPQEGSRQSSVFLAQDSKDTMLITRRVSVTRIHSSTRPSNVRKATPEDDIVAVEEYVDSDGEPHYQRAPSAGRPQHDPSSMSDGRVIVGANCNLPVTSAASYSEEDEEDDFRSQTPAVTGGPIRTTVVAVRGAQSPNEVSSPLPSLASVVSMMSQSSQVPEAVTTYPTRTPKPAGTHFHTVEKRIDTPFPSVCETCGSPRKGGDEDGRRPRTNFW